VNYTSPVIYPGRTPPTVSSEVPDPYARDFVEAALVLVQSPKASAALSRRIVQHLLREKGGFGPSSLNDEIDSAIEDGGLPSGLASDLDALRTVGNFAAHPIKSTHSGEVVEVEPGEAEWLLGLLEVLFDFYFVRPSHRDAQRESLNAKLREAGKPPLKGTSE
jgi:uncharacterized protein DUF4145